MQDKLELPDDIKKDVAALLQQAEHLKAEIAKLEHAARLTIRGFLAGKGVNGAEYELSPQLDLVRRTAAQE
jgi:hypothetical protein